MSDIERFKESILKEHPRLNENSSFRFRCHPKVACFNDCCSDVNIFLTPYDILRLKSRLGISSQEFLDKYTILPFDKNLKYPAVLLRMGENEKRACQFVGEKGCTVYTDRPWACRMYPLGMASPAEPGGSPAMNDFFFLLKEDVCHGHQEDNEYTVKSWLDDQGIDEYNQAGELWKEMTLHPYFQSDDVMPPQKIEMFFMVCYNLDKFRSFVFGSSFLDKFEVDSDTQAKIETDDNELLKFGYTWLRFALFGEKTMTVKSDVLDTKRSELEAKKKI
ncbi:MAG: YkgJ family cysteine cluster protein [bacterium]